MYLKREWQGAGELKVTSSTTSTSLTMPKGSSLVKPSTSQALATLAQSLRSVSESELVSPKSRLKSKSSSSSLSLSRLSLSEPKTVRLPELLGCGVLSLRALGDSTLCGLSTFAFPANPWINAARLRSNCVLLCACCWPSLSGRLA